MSRESGVEIIGIAAPTCAGKTSLVNELQRRVPKLLLGTLSFDEYDLYPAGSEAIQNELEEPSITNWEDPVLFDMVQFAKDLGAVAQGRVVKLRTRSRESMDRGEAMRHYTPRKTNLIEGVFVLHALEARQQMGMTFYIDIPIDVMVERRLATLRPGSEGNPWDDPEYIAGQMVEGTKQFVLPQRKLASVVLDGLAPIDVLADAVMEHTGLDKIS